MTKSAELVAAEDLGNAVVEEVTQEEPKKTTRKAGTKKPRKPAAKKTEEPKAEETKTEETKEPATFHGYAVKKDIDPQVLRDLDKLSEEANKSAKLINEKGKGIDLLKSFVAVGKFSHTVKEIIAAPKQFGQYLKEHLPEYDQLNAPDRSNSIWLYKALFVEGSEGFEDLLELLGLNPMANDKVEELGKFKSANPTVIKREWRNAKKAVEAVEKLEEEGISLGEGETAEEALKRAEKEKREAEEAEELERLKKEDAKMKRALTDFCKAIADDPEGLEANAALFKEVALICRDDPIEDATQNIRACIKAIKDAKAERDQ